MTSSSQSCCWWTLQVEKKRRTFVPMLMEFREAHSTHLRLGTIKHTWTMPRKISHLSKTCFLMHCPLPVRCVLTFNSLPFRISYARLNRRRDKRSGSLASCNSADCGEKLNWPHSSRSNHLLGASFFSSSGTIEKRFPENKTHFLTTIHLTTKEECWCFSWMRSDTVTHSRLFSSSNSF